MTDRNWKDIVADAKRLGIKVHGVKKPELTALVDAELAKGEQKPVGAAEELEAAKDFDPGVRVEITRVNGKGAWWCPVCDHSNSSLMRECGGCGAVKDEDAVITA